VGTIIQDKPQSNPKRQPRWDRFERADLFEHYLKLHALLTDHSPLHVRLFKEQQAAAQWLDVPLESLAA